MTVGFFPAFDPRFAVTYEGAGASLFHHAAVLDAMAEEHGVPTLSSFADDREPLRCVACLLEALDGARALIPGAERGNR